MAAKAKLAPSGQVKVRAGTFETRSSIRARALDDPAPPMVVAGREELLGPEHPAGPIPLAGDRALREAAVVLVDALPQADEIGRTRARAIGAADYGPRQGEHQRCHDERTLYGISP
jgi:hypothetical protein